MYDLAMAPLEWAWARRMRRAILKRAGGRVLEIGVGTGVNLPFYESVERVVGIDYVDHMLQRALTRLSGAPSPADLARADAQDLPFTTGSFDTVVSTLVFCTVPDPLRGMREIRRVLRPGGRFLLMEHVRSSSPAVGRLQEWINPVWKRFSGGCNLDRDTLDTVRVAGFEIDRVVSGFWKVVVLIEAHAPGQDPDL